MVNDSSIHAIDHSTAIIPILFTILLVLLSIIWITILIGQLIFLCFHRSMELVWLSNKIRKNEINNYLAKIALFLAILACGALATIFYAAQQIWRPEQHINCSNEDIFIYGHIFDGFSHLSLLAMISFVNIFTLFTRTVYSYSKDFRLVKVLIIATVCIKIPLLLVIAGAAFTFVWVEVFVILCIFLEYIILIRNERILYRIIRTKLRELERSTSKLHQIWREKRASNLKLYVPFMTGSACLLLLLPINWIQIYIDVSSQCSTKYLLIPIILSREKSDQYSTILNIVMNCLFAPLLCMIFVYIGLTISSLIFKIKTYLKERSNARNEMMEPLVQQD